MNILLLLWKISTGCLSLEEFITSCLFSATRASALFFLHISLTFSVRTLSLASCALQVIYPDSVPRYRLELYGKRNFSRSAPSVWNSLPAVLRETNTTNSFKTHLKTQLFRSIYIQLVPSLNESNWVVYVRKCVCVCVCLCMCVRVWMCVREICSKICFIDEIIML